MPGRNTNTSEYRYAYNGMEKDPELKGEGNSYTTEFRQYDPRLGRWLSLDPLMMQFPSMSPYVAFDNNPIFYTDPLGLAAQGDPISVGTVDGSTRGKMTGVLHDKKAVNAKDEVVFIGKSKSGENLEYRYIYDKENNKWNGTFSQEGEVTSTNIQIDGSEKNKGGLSTTEQNMESTSKASGMIGETIKTEVDVKRVEAKVTIGQNYSTKVNSKNDEYFLNSKGKSTKLYSTGGKSKAPQSMSNQIKNYEKAKVINNTFGKAGKALSMYSEYQEYKTLIMNPNSSAIAEKIILITADKIGDILLRSPTPATVAIGVIVKGSIMIYENWDALNEFFGGSNIKKIPIPSYMPPAKSNPKGVYYDNLDPRKFQYPLPFKL